MYREFRAALPPVTLEMQFFVAAGSLVMRVAATAPRLQLEEYVAHQDSAANRRATLVQSPNAGSP